MNAKRFQFRAIFTKKPFSNEPVNKLVYFNIDGTENGYILCSRSYLEGKYILMQNSTLEDSNGIHIFDGDIVSCRLNDTEHLFEVVFQKGMFAVRIESKKIMGLATLLKKTQVTIIGNKYQHPNLLEQTIAAIPSLNNPN